MLPLSLSIGWFEERIRDLHKRKVLVLQSNYINHSIPLVSNCWTSVKDLWTVTFGFGFDDI